MHLLKEYRQGVSLIVSNAFQAILGDKNTFYINSVVTNYRYEHTIINEVIML